MDIFHIPYDYSDHFKLKIKFLGAIQEFLGNTWEFSERHKYRTSAKMCYNPSITNVFQSGSCGCQAVSWEKNAYYQNSLLDPWGIFSKFCVFLDPNLVIFSVV